MLFNLLFGYYVWKELLWQDKYKKIELRLKYENARSANIVNFV